MSSEAQKDPDIQIDNKVGQKKPTKINKTLTISNDEHRLKAAQHLGVFMVICMWFSTIGSSLTLYAIFNAVLPSALQDVIGLNFYEGGLGWVSNIICAVLAFAVATTLDHYLFAVQLRAGLTELIIIIKRYTDGEFKAYMEHYRHSGLNFTRVLLAIVHLAFGGFGFAISFYTSYESSDIVAQFVKPTSLASNSRSKIDEVHGRMKQSESQAVDEYRNRVRALENEKKAFLAQYLDNKRMKKQLAARNPAALAFADSLNKVAAKQFDSSKEQALAEKAQADWEKNIKPAFSKEMGEIYQSADTKKNYAGMTGFFVSMLGVSACVGMMAIMFVLALRDVEQMPYVIRAYAGRPVQDTTKKGKSDDEDDDIQAKKYSPNAQGK